MSSQSYVCSFKVISKPSRAFLFTFTPNLIYLYVLCQTKTFAREDNVFGSKRLINTLLLALIALDLFLCLMGVVYSGSWLKFIHGVNVTDPQGLMVRLGVVWGTFAFIQMIALARWEKRLYWLPLIAGVRLTESIADWFYLMAANNVSTVGAIVLISIPIANIALGVILILCHRALSLD